MKNSDSIFTRSRMGLDSSVWVTMLVVLVCSIFFLGFKIITHVECPAFEINSSGLRQQTNNVFYVGETVTFSIPVKPNDKVLWDFGDGTPKQPGENIIQHNFLKEDDYNVSCIVNGKCDQGTVISIISKPAKPTDTTQFVGIPIIGADTVKAGVSAHFSTLIKASYSYQWSLSSSPEIKTTPAVDFNFYKDGLQMITLTIDGNKSYKKTILVLPKTPVGGNIAGSNNSLPQQSFSIPPRS